MKKEIPTKEYRPKYPSIKIVSSDAIAAKPANNIKSLPEFTNLRK
tara:strand:+ start:493 stop:627 length:135 start_codon:yes stop_codon:yes gene_type:complete